MLEWVIPALVLAVIDGDTAKVRAKTWLNTEVEVNIRISGVDAPEIGANANCEVERNWGDLAKLYAKHTFEGKSVFITGLKPDKFGSRVVGNLTLPDGTDWVTALAEEGFVRPYTGTGPRPDWCAPSP